MASSRIAGFSSGDLLADRRASYAEMLLGSGDAPAAADLMRQALERVPGWAAGQFRLGELADAAGEPDAAAEAWRAVLRLDADDRFGAGLKLAAMGFMPMPDAPPAAYVESLFDAYAPNFDSALVEKLDYRVPGLIAAAVGAVRPDTLFRHVVDLGCGTGLMGEYLRKRASHLEGIDLSEAMLRKAREKRVYDRLRQADVNRLDLGGPAADLAVAADVFVYLGALDTTFAKVAVMLEPGGLFVFSVERCGDEQDYMLAASLRFAHSPAYIRRLLQDSGFTTLAIAEAELRRDRNAPVQGLIVTAERAGAPDRLAEAVPSLAAIVLRAEG